MPERYSDRFFREQPTASDVLDLGTVAVAPAEVEPEDLMTSDAPRDHWPQRRWHDEWAARTILVLTLIVGLVGGAYGWERWSERQTAADALGAVDLSAWVTTVGYGGWGTSEISMRIHIRNNGNHPVTVESVDLPGQPVRLSSLGEPVEIDVGEVAERPINARAQCNEATDEQLQDWERGAWAVDQPPTARLEVQTADGSDRSSTVMLGVAPDFFSWMYPACQEDEQLLQFSNGYGEVVFVELTEDGTGVTAAYRLSAPTSDVMEVEVTGVRLSGDAFTAALPPDLGVEAPPSGGSVTVRFTVGDCTRAREAQEQTMAVTFLGRFEGGSEGLMTVAPTVDLATALARLAERSCPA